MRMQYPDGAQYNDPVQSSQTPLAVDHLAPLAKLQICNVLMLGSLIQSKITE
jgi:hypothetical protein